MNGWTEPLHEKLATCHVIIGHPTKAKFLAIRHTKGWSPPTVKLPPGPIDYRAAMINEGMSRKYGLHTRVLRALISGHAYHCIEMELVGRGSHRLDAVWVDRGEYERLRAPPDGRPDPFEQWLDERTQKRHPELRPAWEHSGWFDEASHWIQFQLDRMQIQPTGSIEQYRVGSNACCLLRVATGAGMIYFKAAYARPPAEAALAEALARSWPQWIIAPLAIDRERNWMLYTDVWAGTGTPRSVDELLPYVRAMAELQVASSGSLAGWEALGCPISNCAHLLNFAQAPDRIQGWLRAGGDRQRPEETGWLERALDRQPALIERLADLGLPDTLIHADFRAHNLVPWRAGTAFMDWSDCRLGQPFFVLDRLLGVPNEQDIVVGGERWSSLHDDEQQMIQQCYLEPFMQYAPMERLCEALGVARRLYPLWRFMRISEDLAVMEPGGARHRTFSTWLLAVARRLIRESARHSVPAA